MELTKEQALGARLFVAECVSNVFANDAEMYDLMMDAAMRAVVEGMGTGHTVAHYEAMLNGRPDGYDQSDYDATIGIYLRDEVKEWLDEKLSDDNPIYLLLLELLDFTDRAQWEEIAGSFRPQGRDNLAEMREMAGEDDEEEDDEDG